MATPAIAEKEIIITSRVNHYLQTHRQEGMKRHLGRTRVSTKDVKAPVFITQDLLGCVCGSRLSSESLQGKKILFTPSIYDRQPSIDKTICFFLLWMWEGLRIRRQICSILLGNIYKLCSLQGKQQADAHLFSTPIDHLLCPTMKKLLLWNVIFYRRILGPELWLSFSYMLFPMRCMHLIADVTWDFYFTFWHFYP